MNECPFCQIARGDRPARLVYQDDQVTAFHDIRPAAPTHILIIPNEHIDSVNAALPQHEQLLGHLFTVARLVAQQEGVQATGYRLITNTGRDSGQIIFHLHLHLLGGQHMRFPIG